MWLKASSILPFLSCIILSCCNPSVINKYVQILVVLFCSQTARSRYVPEIPVCSKCINFYLVTVYHLLCTLPGLKVIWFCLYLFLCIDKTLVKYSILSTFQSSAAWKTVLGSWSSRKLHSPEANWRNHDPIHLQKHWLLNFSVGLILWSRFETIISLATQREEWRMMIQTVNWFCMTWLLYNQCLFLSCPIAFYGPECMCK